MQKLHQVKVNRSCDWPTYTQTKLNNTLKYAEDCEQQIKYLKSDRASGWVAAVMLLVVLAIVMYQWLVVGAICPIH
jgi:hypothetical protein